MFLEPHRRYGVEDTAIISMVLEYGVTATVIVGRVPYAPSSSPTYCSLRLLGSHGDLTVDEDEPHLSRYDRQDARQEPVFGPSARATLERCLDHVVETCRAGQPPDYTVADGWATLAVIDAAYRSIASGEPAAVATYPETAGNQQPG